MEYKIFKVYKLKQALNLIDKGNKLIYTEQNKKKHIFKPFKTQKERRIGEYWKDMKLKK